MQRIFNIADSRVLQHCGVKLTALETDLPAFTGFDTDLNEEKVAHLKDLHTVTLAEGGDDVVKGQVGEKTQALLDVMKTCDKRVKSLRYWVKKAFANNPAGMKRFMLPKYWKVRNNQPKLVAYMSGLSTVVTELRSSLEESNAPAELLDSFEPLARELEVANNVQENSKGGRGSATQERIMRLNEIYTICKEFSDAAEFIYDDDPAKRELYRIPGNSQPSTEDEEELNDEQDLAA